MKGNPISVCFSSRNSFEIHRYIKSWPRENEDFNERYDFIRFHCLEMCTSIWMSQWVWWHM